MHDTAERASLPPSFAPSPLAEVVVLSDLWSPIAEVQAHDRAALRHRRARPRRADRRSGRGDLPLFRPRRVHRAGRRRQRSRPAAPRPGATTIRRCMARHRAEIRAETDRLGWSFAIHRTDRPASELLLALHARMGAGAQLPSVASRHAPAQPREARHDPRPAARLRPAAGAARPAQPAGAVVAAAAGAAAPAPHRVSADAAAVRHRAEGRDAGAHAVVADAAAADAGGAGHHRGRRAVVESAAGDRQPRRADAAADRRRLGGGRDLGRAPAHRRRDHRARRQRQPRRRAACRCRSRRATFRCRTPGAARVRLQADQAEAAYASTAPRRCRRITRFLAGTPDVEVVWLSDGVDLGNGAEFVDGPQAGRSADHPLTVVDGGLAPAHALAAADNAAGALDREGAARAAGAARERHGARARSQGPAARRSAVRVQAAASARPKPTFDLPVEIRNDIARLEIVGERSAGAVQLLDKRWRRRTVGVISGSTADTLAAAARPRPIISRARSIRSPTCGSRKAPRRREAVTRFLDQNLPMLILADVGNVAGEARDRLAKWIEDGGVLVRFAGPRLAAADDDLVPVKLRRGGRILGGSLSWEQPQQLAAFSRESPFNGMAVPNDVTVTRQVLAEPDARPDRPHLGDARRRHAAGHRGAPRQGPDRAVSRHRRHALVGPAAVRRVRRHAQAHRRAVGRGRQRRRSRQQPTSRDAPWCRRPACSTASARSARRRRPRGRCRRISPPAPTPIIRPASTARRKACSRSTRWRRPTGPVPLDFAALNGDLRSLSARRAARSARAGVPGRARAAGARCAGGVLAVRRPERVAAAPARRRRHRRLPAGCAAVIGMPQQAPGASRARHRRRKLSAQAEATSP